MSQVKSYQEEKAVKYSASLGNRVHGEKVKTGKTLRVTHMSGKFDNVQTTEYIELGYYNGHAYVPLKKDKPAVAGDPVHWNGNVWLREGQYVYAYFADVAADEVMRLNAEGRWV